MTFQTPAAAHGTPCGMIGPDYKDFPEDIGTGIIEARDAVDHTVGESRSTLSKPVTGVEVSF